MAQFKFTNKAIKDLSEIWNYTFKHWSEKQANRYYQSLIASYKEIAENPNLGKSYNGVAQNLFGIKTNRHIIFYRNVDQKYVEITRILHQRMDLKNRLTE